MARSKGYIINGQFFKTKDAIRKKMREILYAYPVGAKVNDEDSAFLLEMLHNHPKAIEKIGCGIEAFEVRQETSISRCLYLVRIDGTAENFGYKKCLNPPTPLAVFKTVCRNLVYPQMYKLKSSHLQMHVRRMAAYNVQSLASGLRRTRHTLTIFLQRPLQRSLLALLIRIISMSRRLKYAIQKMLISIRRLLMTRLSRAG